MVHFVGGEEIFLSRCCMACGATQMLVCSDPRRHSFHRNFDETWSIRSKVEMQHMDGQKDKQTGTRYGDFISLFGLNIMLNWLWSSGLSEAIKWYL